MRGEESDRLAEAIRRVIRDGMHRSPEVRGLLLELARVVIAEDERIGPGTVSAEGVPVGVEAEGAADGTGGGSEASVGSDGHDQGAPAAGEPGRVPLERLKIGGATISDGGSIPSSRGTGTRVLLPAREAPVAFGANEIDLGMIAKRCRLKAESCRFFVERRAHEHDASREGEFSSRINTMIATAKSLPSCFLWVFWKEAKQPSDAELHRIAECYDALADAAELCERSVDAEQGLVVEEVESAFALLAEASSALRIAVGWTWLTSADTDQDESHLWLRRETASRMIYVSRHMMLDDPADPARAEGVRRDIARIAEGTDRRQRQVKKIEAWLNKARYHAKRIVSAPEPDEHDCAKVNEAIGELAGMGLRASDRRLSGIRELVGDVAFHVTVGKHPWLETDEAPRRAAEDDDERDEGSSWSERVLRVRELLRGGRIVIIGGEPRQGAIARIEDAFELDGVDWIHLSEHGSAGAMEAPIRREQTRLVLVLIKLTGHLYAERAREFAAEAGKACVLMPAGYNPEQIAAQVLNQADERLEQVAPAGGG